MAGMMIPKYPDMTGAAPRWYDITGEAHPDYAHLYGPHQGTVCNCPECYAFNLEFESRQEQEELLRSVQYAAREATYNLYGSQMVDMMGKFDLSYLTQIMADFAKRQIAQYQERTVKKVRTLQIAHDNRERELISRVRTGNDLKAAEASRVKDHCGRMFREE